MKPYVISHMIAGIDGRIQSRRWRPRGASSGGHYERIHDRLDGDAWMVGRVTGQELATGATYPQDVATTLPREPWIARSQAEAFAVVLDPHGKIAWGSADIGGDPLVVVLTEQVSDGHLAGLRRDGVSYIFAGERAVDLAAALESLHALFGIRRILLEGGGHVNGAFLRAGLIDEVSLLVVPAIDGARGAPSVFDSAEGESASAAPISSMALTASEVLDGGIVWLRYSLTNG